jgi:transposase
LATVYNIAANLKTHGSVRKPPDELKKLGAPSKITDADAEALFEELIRSGWLYQDEIVHWLQVERGVKVTQATISRFLKSMKWSRRTLRPYSINRNEDLRDSYRRTMRNFAAEDLVFLDEAIFNEKTGWRHHAYAPVGHEARYTQSIDRGDTWAILPAYTVHGYLPCTAIKQGYFNMEEFIHWLQNHLFPTLRSIYSQKPVVIVLDNVSIHTNHRSPG